MMQGRPHRRMRRSGVDRGYQKLIKTMSAIPDELLFRRMLALERRRCERTEEHFALMLIDFEGLSRTVDTPAMEEIGLAVSAAMRETDITGWYQHPAMLGVILTTLNGTGRDT